MIEPGKFQGCADPEVGARLHDASVNGVCDEEVAVGSGDWYGLLGDAILWENDQGFFDYTIFGSEAEAREQWDVFLGMCEVEGMLADTDD